MQDCVGTTVFYGSHAGKVPRLSPSFWVGTPYGGGSRVLKQEIIAR